MLLLLLLLLLLPLFLLLVLLLLLLLLLPAAAKVPLPEHPCENPVCQSIHAQTTIMCICWSIRWPEHQKKDVDS